MKMNQLKIGVVLSYVNLLIGSIIPFVYTPLMLQILGQSEYGLYSLSSSTVGYLSLLSFGFGSTIVRYLSKCRADNDEESLKVYFGFFFKLYSCLAILVIVGGFIISNNVATIFAQGLTLQEISKMRILVLIMTLNCAISFPLSVFSAVIITYERFFFRRLLDLFFTIAAPVINLITLSLGLMSVGMAWATTFLQIFIFWLYVYYCYKVLNVMPKFGKLPFSLIGEMVKFSTFVFIGSIVDLLFWSTDKVILGMLVGATSVAVYNVGGTFNSMVISLSTSISGVLVPKITGMVVTDTPKEKLSELFIKVGRLQFIIIALIVSGFSVFGISFINLWAGTDYADAYWVAVLTMFPLCIPLIQNTGLSIITAQNKHQFRSIVYLTIAILNVVTTYLCIPYFGLIGAAICSSLSYLIGHGVIMNLYYYKVTKLDIPSFWSNILKMSLIPVLMMVISLLLSDYVYLNNWGTFIIGVLSYTFIYAVLMYCFALNGYEKDIFRKPVFMVLKKIQRG